MLATPRPTEAEQRAWLKAHPRWAWRHGVLWHLLDSNQLRAYKKIRRALGKPFARFVLNWARRTGKTFVLFLIAVEDASRLRKARFNVAAATKESLREFIWPALDLILETCPQDLRPHIQESRGRVTFKRSGSVIVLAGCNDKRSVERLRGPRSNGNIIEEMGAIPDDPGLRYILQSVLNPQLMTTGGWTLMATTPPKSAGHAAAMIVLHAEASGTYDHCTLYDNPRLTPELIAAYLESDAGLLGYTVEEYKASVAFRREWLAIIETDPTYAVLPTFTHERAKRIVTEATDTPVFMDRYTAMDPGFSPDWTGILYAAWSFQHQRLRIMGERVMRRMGTPELAEAIKEDEARLWGRHKPFFRTSDNNWPILLRDLSMQFALTFHATEKDQLRVAIADVNRWIANGTISIDPSCTMLKAQMIAATWNRQGTEFERTEEFGHFDLVAALIYLVRNVLPNINRVPPHYGLSEEKYFLRPEPPSPQDAALLELGGDFDA